MDTLVFIFWGVFLEGEISQLRCCFQILHVSKAGFKLRQEVELTSTSAQAVTTKHEVQVVPERIFVAKKNTESEWIFGCLFANHWRIILQVIWNISGCSIALNFTLCSI